MLTKNQYSRQGRPPYFSNFVVLTMGSTSGFAFACWPAGGRWKRADLSGKGDSSFLGQIGHSPGITLRQRGKHPCAHPWSTRNPSGAQYLGRVYRSAAELSGMGEANSGIDLPDQSDRSLNKGSAQSYFHAHRRPCSVLFHRKIWLWAYFQKSFRSQESLTPGNRGAERHFVALESMISIPPPRTRPALMTKA